MFFLDYKKENQILKYFELKRYSWATVAYFGVTSWVFFWSEAKGKTGVKIVSEDGAEGLGAESFSESSSILIPLLVFQDALLFFF